jgi:hypothetical protein
MNLNNYRLHNHTPFQTVYILLGKLTNTANGFFSHSLFFNHQHHAQDFSKKCTNVNNKSIEKEQ